MPKKLRSIHGQSLEWATLLQGPSSSSITEKLADWAERPWDLLGKSLAVQMDGSLPNENRKACVVLLAPIGY